MPPPSCTRLLAGSRSLFDDALLSPSPLAPPSSPLMSCGRSRVCKEVRGLRRGDGGCCSLADVTCSPETSAKLIHDSVSVCRRELTHHVPVACLRRRSALYLVNRLLRRRCLFFAAHTSCTSPKAAAFFFIYCSFQCKCVLCNIHRKKKWMKVA